MVDPDLQMGGGGRGGGGARSQIFFFGPLGPVWSKNSGVRGGGLTLNLALLL